MADKWKEEMDDQQRDHFADLLENLKPEERNTLGSLPNNSNDAPVFKDNERSSDVERNTFVHGFSNYQKRDNDEQPLRMKQDYGTELTKEVEDDFNMNEPKMFNPTIIQ